MLQTAVAVPRVVSVVLSIVSESKALVVGGKNESVFDDVSICWITPVLGWLWYTRWLGNRFDISQFLASSFSSLRITLSNSPITYICYKNHDMFNQYRYAYYEYIMLPFHNAAVNLLWLWQSRDFIMIFISSYHDHRDVTVQSFIKLAIVYCIISSVI